MAATVEGTFRLLDRASAPLRKMEQQARKTDRAFESLGKKMDRAVGTQVVRRVEALTSKLKALDRELQQKERDFTKFENKLAATSRKLDDAGDSANRLRRDIADLGNGGNDGFTKLQRGAGGAAHGMRALGIAFKALGISAIVVLITTLVQALGTAVGAVVAFTGSITQLVGALAAAPAMIGALVQSVAAMAAGLSGTFAAIGAGLQQQKQAHREAIDWAERQERSMRAIRDAHYGVQAAEEGVQRAQWASRDAQRALTDARRAARRELVDMRLAAEGTMLGERAASLALQRARRNLENANFTGPDGDLQEQEAQLAVRQAQLSLRQARVERTRTRADAARAMKGDSPGQRGVEQAQRGITEASRGARDALRQQVRATEALTDAQRDQARMMRDGTASQLAYKQALKDLSPEQRAFVERAVGMRDEFLKFRAAAGRDLMPHLTDTLGHVSSLLPVMGRAFNRTGGEIGRVIEGWARELATVRRNDVSTVMNHQANLAGKMARSFRNIMNALLDLAIAARPFTNWMTRTIEHWTKHVALTTQAKRATGQMADSLDRVKTAMQQWGRILANSWGTLRGIGRAARPVTQWLTDGFEEATAASDEWANSLGGRLKLRQWFEDLKPGMVAVKDLLGALSEMFAKITVDPNFARTLNTLTQGVGPLTRLTTTFGALGPALADLVVSAIELGNALPISVLEVLTKTLEGAVDAATWLLREMPGLGVVIATALGGAAILGALDKVQGRVQRIGELWRNAFSRIPGVGGGGPVGKVVGSRMTVMNTVANPVPVIVVGGGGLPGGKPGTGPVVVPGGGPGGGSGKGGRGGSFGAAYRNSRAAGGGRLGALGAGFRSVPGSVRGGLAALGTSAAIAGGGSVALGAAKMAPGALRGVGGKLLTGAKGLGKAFLPLGAAIGGIEGMTEAFSGGGGIGNRAARFAQGFGDSITFGATSKLRGLLGIGDVVSPEEQERQQVAKEAAGIQRALAGAGGDNPTTIKQLRDQIRILETGIAVRQGEKGAEAELRREMEQRLSVAKQLGDEMHRQRALEREQRGIRRAGRVGGDLGGIFKTYRESLGDTTKATRRTVSTIKGELKGMRGEGREILANQAMDWINSQKKAGTISTAEARRAKRNILEQLRQGKESAAVIGGQVVTGQDGIWRSVRAAISDPVEQARQDVTRGFTDMQKQAVNALVQSGMDRSQARSYISRRESGEGHKEALLASERGRYGMHAQGGRIRGQGLHDTVQVAPRALAAPGELIVNRHTEAKLDSVLGQRGALDRIVKGENTRHAAAVTSKITGRGGKGYHHLSSRGKGHQTGGRVDGEGINVDGSKPGFAVLMAHFRKVARDQALYVMSGFRGGSITTSGNVSNHASGDAIDISNPVSASGTAANPPPRNSLDRLASYISANIAAPPRRDFLWRTMTGGNHYNHIHLGMDPSVTGSLSAARQYVGGLPGAAANAYRGVFATDGAGGGAAIPRINLRGAQTRAPGLAGAIGNRYLARVRRGLERAANRALGAGGGGQTSAGGAFNKSRLVALAESVGMPNPNLMAAIALAESSGNPGAVGPPTSGGRARGLWQIMWPLHSGSFPGRDPFNPKDNAYMAKSILSSQGLSAWEAYSRGMHQKYMQQGGRVAWGGWYGEGGTFDVRRPTVIGVGERGEERVTVTPKGRSSSGGRGRPVKITIGHITNHEPGDIRKIVERELAGLVDDLELVGEED